MARNYVSKGEVLQHSPSANVTSGSVVIIEGLIGIALADITAGATGSVAISGVFRVPKVSAAVIQQVETLVWDSSEGAFDDNQAAPASGDVTGVSVMAAASAGSGDTSLPVKLTGVPGTVN
ncbi:MAG: capsid cement protein [Pseudomonadota bacterium]